MRRFLLLLVFGALTMSVISCTSMLPDRFERFVDRVDKNASTYTERNWDSVSKDFSKLMEMYEKSYDKLNSSQRQRIDKAIGRYRAIVFKSGISSVIQSANEILLNFSATIKGFLDSIGSFFDELGAGE